MTIEEFLQSLNRQNFGPDDSTIVSSARHPVKAAKKLGNYIDSLMRTGMGQTYSDDAFTYAPLDSSRLAAANEIAGYAQVGSMPFAPKTRGGTLGTAALPDTEFSKAHKIAQENAALPIEQGGLGLAPDNTAMGRAKAMGFKLDAKLYRGTDANEIEAIGRHGPYVSDRPEVASFHANLAQNEGANVMPLIGHNDFIHDDNAIDYWAGGKAYQVPPGDIRSIFAAFDPMKKNSPNILASTLMGMLIAREQDKK